MFLVWRSVDHLSGVNFVTLFTYLTRQTYIDSGSDPVVLPFLSMSDEVAYITPLSEFLWT